MANGRGMTRKERIAAAALLGEKREARNPDAKYNLRSREDYEKWRRSSAEIGRRAARTYGAPQPLSGCVWVMMLPVGGLIAAGIAVARGMGKA